jgi:hypothetical protein
MAVRVGAVAESIGVDEGVGEGETGSDGVALGASVGISTEDAVGGTGVSVTVIDAGAEVPQAAIRIEQRDKNIKTFIGVP